MTDLRALSEAAYQRRSAEFARLVEAHPIEQRVYDASDAGFRVGYQAAVEACHIVNRPFTLWQGTCGHVWDRAVIDSTDCPYAIHRAGSDAERPALDSIRAAIKRAIGDVKSGRTAPALDELEGARAEIDLLAAAPGDAERLRKALLGLVRHDIDGTPCWCSTEPSRLNGWRHVQACLDATFALAEPRPLAALDVEAGHNADTDTGGEE